MDILILNDLPTKDPAMAFEVVSRGRVLVCKNLTEYVNFKTAAILRYLDTAYLREMVNKAFMRRLEEGKIGERSHA